MSATDQIDAYAAGTIDFDDLIDDFLVRPWTMVDHRTDPLGEGLHPFPQPGTVEEIEAARWTGLLTAVEVETLLEAIDAAADSVPAIHTPEDEPEVEGKEISHEAASRRAKLGWLKRQRALPKPMIERVQATTGTITPVPATRRPRGAKVTTPPGYGVPHGRNAPMTDAEWAARKTYAENLGKEWRYNGPHDTSVMYAGPSGGYTAARVAQQQALIQKRLDDADARGVPYEGDAIMTGGLPGAGKSSLLNDPTASALMRLTPDPNGGEPLSHMTITADIFKDDLIAAGMVDVPPGVTPMEAGNLVQNEARDMAAALLEAAVAKRMNVVIDGIMSDQNFVAAKAQKLRNAGYTIGGVFVDVSVPKAQFSSEKRLREGIDDYEVHGKGLGARRVPPSFIAESAATTSTPKVDDGNGSKVLPMTTNRAVFQQLQEAGVFDEALVFSNEGATLDDYPKAVIYGWPPP